MSLRKRIPAAVALAWTCLTLACNALGDGLPPPVPLSAIAVTRTQYPTAPNRPSATRTTMPPSPTPALSPTPTPLPKVTVFLIHAQPSGNDDTGISESDPLHAINIVADSLFQLQIRFRVSSPMDKHLPTKLYAYHGGSATDRPPAIEREATLVGDTYWLTFTRNPDTRFVEGRATSVWYMEILDPSLSHILWSGYIRVNKP
jgi:hypothetical protein